MSLVDLDLARETAKALADVVGEGLDLESWADAAEAACQIAAEIDRQVKSEVPPATPLACAKGCAFCCHLKVRVTMPELLRLARGINELDAPRQHSLKERIAAAARRLAGAGDLDRVLFHPPCALLDQGACQVYEQRPMACAAAGSFDAKACERGLHEDPEFPIPRYMATAVINEAVQVGLLMLLADHGFAPDLYDLAQALPLLFDSEAAEAWLEGEVVYEQALAERLDLGALLRDPA